MQRPARWVALLMDGMEEQLGTWTPDRQATYRHSEIWWWDLTIKGKNDRAETRHTLDPTIFIIIIIIIIIIAKPSGLQKFS
ncbi:hypothetical protein L3X38_040233 [Prunus dulcis]|uniref:Uncharacterized protein n=1 Tax=Prunus dulcis TaxID=3755 RepID=A0AAD4V8Q0_PRUDU|nr:hypothetical protein L3X38_040233 [Prunus dulcis]